MNNEQKKLITAVEKQKRAKHRYNIFVNEEYAFSVHEDVLVKYRLLKGETIDPQQVAILLEEDDRHRAYLDALRCISVRPHSSQEVTMKLKQKGYESPLIESTIQRLMEQKYLNDEEFARLWTEQRIHSQKKGRKWVQMELAQKGVSQEDIATAVNEINEETEFQAALEIGRKKWRHQAGDMLDRKRKLLAFLLRRGYSQNISVKVIKQLQTELIIDINN